MEMSGGTRSNSEKSNGFAQELAACWRELPHKGFFLSLLGLWLLLFQFLGNSTFGYVDTPSLFHWLYNAYNSTGSEDGHGNLIPFVVLGLFWWKRKDLQVIEKGPWPPALIGIGAGLLLHVMGYVAQQPRVSVIGFFTGLYFLTGLAWGRAWLVASFFPFVLFAFCIPVGSLAESITFPLRRLVTWFSVGFSHLVLGVDVVRDGTRIFDSKGTFQYDVAPACSGMRSLISLFALTTIYGFVSFKTAWKRGVCVVSSLPLAIVGNVVRIVAVILAAETFGEKAGAKVHDGAGFITFAIALGCIFLLGSWLREDGTHVKPAVPQ